MIVSIIKFEVTLVANDLENFIVDRILHFAGVSVSCEFDPRKIKNDLFLFFLQKLVVIYDQRRINERIRRPQSGCILLLLNAPSPNNIGTLNQLFSCLIDSPLAKILISKKLEDFGLQQ